MRCVTMVLIVLVFHAPLSAQTARVPGWRLVEDLRIGGADDDIAEFAELRDVATTPDGHILALDYKLQELKMFDAKGRFVRRAALRGEGPGELMNANGIAVASDGTIWINDPGNDRFSIYRANGTFLRQVTIPITSFGYRWEGVIDQQGRAIDPMHSRFDFKTKQHNPTPAVRYISATGKADTVETKTCDGPLPAASTSLAFDRADGRGGMSRAIPFIARPQTAVTRTGVIWCTPSSDYRLRVALPGQPYREVVRRTVPPVPVTTAERRREERMIDSIVKNYGPIKLGSAADIPRTKPVIAAIFADDAGNAWVRRTDTPASRPAFDVFNPSGRHLATVQSSGEIGTIVEISGGTLLTVLRDEYDVPIIVRYRIAR